MTETPTHTPLPCPCCRSAEIENERPDSPVYCRKCWLRAVDLERWNTRADSHHRLVEALQENLTEKFAQILECELSESYDCTRVWSAWGYGTMGEDDFTPVINRIDQIASELARAALKEARHG